MNADNDVSLMILPQMRMPLLAKLLRSAMRGWLPDGVECAKFSGILVVLPMG